MCCLLIFCFAWPISTTDTYYSLELGTEIIQFEDQVRFCGAQRRKFVKNQIKPKWRTSFEVSRWALLKEFFRAWFWQKYKQSWTLSWKFKINDRFLKHMSVNNRNVWNKDKWTRLNLELVIKTPSIKVKPFETLEGRRFDWPVIIKRWFPWSC